MVGSLTMVGQGRMLLGRMPAASGFVDRSWKRAHRARYVGVIYILPLDTRACVVDVCNISHLEAIEDGRLRDMTSTVHEWDLFGRKGERGFAFL